MKAAGARIVAERLVANLGDRGFEYRFVECHRMGRDWVVVFAVFRAGREIDGPCVVTVDADSGAVAMLPSM